MASFVWESHKVVLPSDCGKGDRVDIETYEARNAGEEVENGESLGAEREGQDLCGIRLSKRSELTSATFATQDRPNGEQIIVAREGQTPRREASLTAMS